MAVVCGSKLGSRQKSTNLEGGSGVNRLSMISGPIQPYRPQLRREVRPC